MLIDGEVGFCIQRGYPFRSTVSDIQMTRTVADNITMAEWIRLNLTNFTEGVGMEYFRGWGSWTLNGDHTDASQVSKTGAPSSDVIRKILRMDMYLANGILRHHLHLTRLVLRDMKVQKINMRPL